MQWGYFFILLAGMIVLNLKALTVDIPWRGDEDIHIARTVALASIIPNTLAILFVIGLITMVTLAWWKKSKWAIFLVIFFAACAIAYHLAKNPLAGINSYALLRYPFINYWFFAIVPMAARALKINPYQEVFFRIVPFLSTFFLVWIFQNSLSGSKAYVNLLWGLAAATIPLVYYYSSILYIELPAICLMLIVCLNIKSLLKDDYRAIRQNPAWYALILIGFVKETTIPFLVCFIGWRLIVQVVQGRITPNAIRSSLRSLGEELLIALAVLLPIIFYLFLRGTLSQQSREFSFNIVDLTKPIVFSTIIRSFYDQFGLLPEMLFVGSCIYLLFWKKEYSQTGFYLSLISLYPLFFAVDTLIYTGYSRFNLFVLPVVLAGVAILPGQLVKYKKIISTITACAILVINVWVSPVNLDGTKKPLWGNYLTDTSEHYYPYREALEWLKSAHGNEPMMFAGMYYPYRFDFYFGQLAWTPVNTVLMTNIISNPISLARAFAEAGTDNINIVLFQVLGGQKASSIAIGPNFYVEKIFQNDAHTLIVYHREP